jgi:hypothetical protein
MTTLYLLSLNGRSFADITLAQAKAIFNAARDRSGLGASQWPNGKLYVGRHQVGYISYNGRAWQGTEPRRSGEQPPELLA